MLRRGRGTDASGSASGPASGAPTRPKPGTPGNRTIDRFTKPARAVLMASEAQARATGSATVEPHHLLLALVAVPGPVAWHLVTSGFDETRLRTVLARAGVARPPERVRVPLRSSGEGERPSFAPDVGHMLAWSVKTADGWGHAEVGPGHLAAAVLMWSTMDMAAGTPVRAVVDDLGVDAQALARALVQG